MDQVTLRELKIGDAGWLIQRHAELYAEAEGFDATFEGVVAEILGDFLQHRDSSCEQGWIAERDGQRLGSVFCTRLDAETAKLRLFLVVPEARGTGVGKALLSACLEYARAKGYRRMTLWTHESHRAACALYARAGFKCVSSKPVRNFGCDLIEQSWEIML